jgi:hypothetical protein
MRSGISDTVEFWKKGTFRFVFVSTLWAAVVSSLIGLSDQEAYYWTWSKVLDWSYFEHPPLQAWITRSTSFFLGDSPFSIRFVCFFGDVFWAFIFSTNGPQKNGIKARAY